MSKDQTYASPTSSDKMYQQVWRYVRVTSRRAQNYLTILDRKFPRINSKEFNSSKIKLGPSFSGENHGATRAALRRSRAPIPPSRPANNLLSSRARRIFSQQA